MAMGARKMADSFNTDSRHESMEQLTTYVISVNQRISRYLRSIESIVYTKYYDLYRWQAEQLSKLDESPSSFKLLVDSPTFGLAVFFTISCHAMISAFAVNYRAAGWEFPLAMDGFLDLIFLSVYVCEVCLRVLAYGRVFLLDAWNVIDVFLIFVETLDIFYLTSSTHIILFRMLRSMRLLRLLRSLRLFRQLRILWMSFVAGMVALCWACVLLLLFTFIFAVFLTDVLNSAPPGKGELMIFVPDQNEFVSIYFGSVGRSMLTLFQVCTLENWADGLMRPAEAIVPGLQWVFIAYVILISIGLTNMIIGVFCEQCSATSFADAEYRRAIAEVEFVDQLEELRELFSGYDTRGNEDGTITMDEFEELSKDPRFQIVLDSVPFATATELFEGLDHDGDGSLDVEEFVHGVQLCRAHPTGLDMANCITLLRQLREDYDTLTATVKSFMQRPGSEHVTKISPPASEPPAPPSREPTGIFLDVGKERGHDQSMMESWAQENREMVGGGSGAVGSRLDKVEESLALMSERMMGIDANMTQKLGFIMSALGVPKEPGQADVQYVHSAVVQTSTYREYVQSPDGQVNGGHMYHPGTRLEGGGTAERRAVDHQGRDCSNPLRDCIEGRLIEPEYEDPPLHARNNLEEGIYRGRAQGSRLSPTTSAAA
jgi:voltage-gated sodium channel